MILPSVTATISFANQLLIVEIDKNFCSDIVMFSDESNDNEVPEGIKWDLWKQTTQEVYAIRGTGISVIPSDAAAMPFQKATCYGYYPSYEVDSMQLIECQMCGTVLKAVGYGHHLRIRHSRAKSPNSNNECQTFLLSPLRITSPRHSDVGPSSPSFLKASASFPMSLSEEPERSYPRIISPQYSIEQRDDLKLALRVSRRDLSQMPSTSNEYVKHISSVSSVVKSEECAGELDEKFVSGCSRKKVLNGRTKSKKKKKRRPRSSSSDDFSLDHIRSSRRSEESRHREMQQFPSTSANISTDSYMVEEEEAPPSSDHVLEQPSSVDISVAVGGITCNEAEERSSESPELRLVDLLRSSKKATMRNSSSNSVRTRLRSFANASLKRPYQIVEHEDSWSATGLSSKRKHVPSCSSSPILPSQDSSDPVKEEGEDDIFDIKPSTSFAPSLVEEEKPPVLKPEVYVVKTEAVKHEEEPLVVEACGSNTFILSSKSKRRSMEGKTNQDADGSSAEQPSTESFSSITKDLNLTIPSSASSDVKEDLFYDASTSFENEDCFATAIHSEVPQQHFFRSSNPKPIQPTTPYAATVNLPAQPSSVYCATEEMYKQQQEGFQSYDTVMNGAFDDRDYGSESCSYRDNLMLNGVISDMASHNNQVVPSAQGSYFSEEELDVPNESDEVACTSSRIQYKETMNPSNPFPSGNITVVRGPSGIVTIQEKTEKENTILLRKQSAQSQTRQHWSQALKSAGLRKTYHRVYRLPQSATIQFSNLPKRRIIFAQRKHEEIRYANARVNVAKVLGTRLDCPEFQKRSPPYVSSSKEVQYDSYDCLGERPHVPTNEIPNDGSENPRGVEPVYQDSRYVPLSANSSFSLKVGDITSSVGTTSQFDDTVSKEGDDSFISGGAVMDDDIEIIEHRQNPAALSRNQYVSATGLLSTNPGTEHQMFHIVTPVEAQRSSALYFSAEGASTSSIPPSLSPQPPAYQSFQPGPLASESEGNNTSVTSEMESLPPRLNGWTAVDANGTVGHFVRQLNLRRNQDTPPVLKRMHTITTEPLSRRDFAASREFVPISGTVRRIARQQSELRIPADLSHYQNVVMADESTGGQLIISNSAIVARDGTSMAPAGNVYRVVNNGVSVVRPTILAGGTKRYRVLPSVKSAPVEEATVYSETVPNAYRPVSTASGYFDVRSTVRVSQENSLHGSIAPGMRIGQRPVAVVPILNRYSSSAPRLNGLTSMYSASSPSLQSSNSATCISAVLPKTRMC